MDTHRYIDWAVLESRAVTVTLNHASSLVSFFPVQLLSKVDINKLGVSDRTTPQSKIGPSTCYSIINII